MAHADPFSVSNMAERVFDGLRTHRTDRGLEDLGHGSVELLREVTLRLRFKDQFMQGNGTLQALSAVLLLLKCFLLKWDSQCFAQHEEFALPNLPHGSSMLKFRHTHPQIFLSEVQSCVKFLTANSKVFSDEPWLWLKQCLEDLLMKHSR